MDCFGIDFGTTNTAVSQIKTTAHGVTIAHHGVGDLPIPSLVAIHPDKETLFGRDVKISRSRLVKEGYHVFSSFKSILGADCTYRIGSKAYTPVHVTAMFLRYLRDLIQAESGVEIREAAFAIPVGFRPEQRKALREAASLAGITVRSFVSEPTAAYVNCGEEMKECTHVAVLDWGGGTLDVSVVSASNAEYDELSTGGKRMGGDEIDRLIAQHVHARIMHSEALPCRFDEMPSDAQDSIIERCEYAKIDLSSEDIAQLRLVHYGTKQLVKESITIDELNSLIEPQVATAIQFLESIVGNAGLSLTQLDAILMVGGSCEMRAICDAMDALGQQRHVRVYHPDKPQWVVADGAARISAQNPIYRLQNGFGVMLSDGSFYPLIEKGSVVPCETSEVRFGVVEDTHTAVFLFADDSGLTLRRTQLSIKGFTAEKLMLRTWIDADLIAHVQMKSDYLTKHAKEECFDQLRFAYCIQ